MNQKSEQYWIKHLELTPHPEGGFFRSVSQSAEIYEFKDGYERSLYTSIYFLLNQENPSHFHRLKSDEVWYFHAGNPLTVHMLYSDGRYNQVTLGGTLEKNESLQFTVPKGVIFGSTVENHGGYSLVSCMVSPGFDYKDFELFTQAELLKDYPQHKSVIEKLAFKTLPD
ncbi:cupin domain-containing protein [Carnobacterium funditum]|uniref:cupin domain-containing protein n=1 Tax=Carnobacterium funditum TaxID=2752 RepID=UPI00054E171F|nr:cupin domain-containing protein [Carnobacterium funditum]